jgi:hypothetical protein
MRKAAFNTIKPDLSSNYYNLLADTTLPDCQVEEQKSTEQENINSVNEQSIKSKVLRGIIPFIIADSAAAPPHPTSAPQRILTLSFRRDDHPPKYFNYWTELEQQQAPSVSYLSIYEAPQKKYTTYLQSLRTRFSASPKRRKPDTSPYLTTSRSTFTMHETRRC